MDSPMSTHHGRAGDGYFGKSVFYQKPCHLIGLSWHLCLAHKLMTIPDPMSATTDLATDAELVAATLAGDRRAFGKIVERYQRLLCSLAYSATGELSQSEDLAQEAFVDGWRQLGTLREPDKLRPWLCGILRFKVSRLRRADGREPARHADVLDAANELESGEDSVPDLAAQKEEQALMWSALERVPEIYREPLVLYYREHRSVEHVAAALDLTEDTVKQRLARGRKVLQEQVLAFVEGALTRTTPGKVFTISVLAALPAFVAPTPAHAATVAVAAAHGSALAKSTALAVLLSSVSGVVSAVLQLRASLDQSRTPRERRLVVKVTAGFFFGAWAWLSTIYLLRASAFHWWDHRLAFALITQVLVLGFIAVWAWAILRVMRAFRRLRSQERREHPECFRSAIDQPGSTAGEYRSRWQLFGVPLVAIRFRTPDEGEKPVYGWIAGGDRAYGLLVAWGGYAVAPVSVGAVAVGVLAIGNVSVGWISLGTVGVGWIAIGCASVGHNAAAWLSALGWESAQGGGFAFAQQVALAPVAFAQHANDAIAHQYLAKGAEGSGSGLFLGVLALISVVPVAYYARAVRRRLGQAARRD
jgi:RNA polymerase sigma factor (sigma-70 family)